MRLRAFLRRRLERVPAALIDLGTCITLMGRMSLFIIEEQEVRYRTQRRMRAEGLVRGRDDARACAIAAEELARYRVEFQDDLMKIEVKPFDAIDPWKSFSDGA
jgi:hypothetical protein